jgi:dipeptide transport system substrate-binding protein
VKKVLTFFLALGLVACTSAQVGKKTFVYCSEGSPTSFSPPLPTDGTSHNAGSVAIFNRLVEFEYGTTNIVPALAESWEISKDNLSYTFHLRKGVKWQTTEFFKPTREFNADDVLFSFNRQRLKDHPYHFVGGGSYEYFDSMDMGATIKDIIRVDDYTLTFVLNKAQAPFLANLAMDFASIMSAEFADLMMKAKTPDKLDTQPVGTGAYIFDRYEKDSLIRYHANPDYWRGKARIEKLVFIITVDPNVRTQKLKTGECDLIAEPALADLGSLKSDTKLKVEQLPGLNILYLAFNVEKKPYDNVFVRQAINYALNRNSYIDAIYLGHAQVAKNPMPPTIWGYNNEAKDYEYNPNKAKELLKKAGFPNGFSTELWTMPVSRPYIPNGKKMGELMQSDLAKVGINVRLVTYDWPTYLTKSKAGEHVMLQMGWTGDNGDPDNFLATLLSCAAVAPGQNRARWCYKPYDDLVTKGAKVSDQNARTELYKKAQVVFKEQAPWVTIAHSMTFRAMKKSVVGFKMDPLGHDHFYELDLQ